MFEVASRAPDKPTFLQRPDLGRALSDEARAELTQADRHARPTLVVIYGDGLSAAAINQHLAEFHGALVPALAARGIAHAPPFFVRRSRVKIMDEIARLVGAQAALFVCGERPGLGFADSLSAYYIYQPAAGATDADREVISNINPRGRPPADAARRRRRGDRAHPAREEVGRRAGRVRGRSSETARAELSALARREATRVQGGGRRAAACTRIEEALPMLASRVMNWRPGRETRSAAAEAARAGRADDPGRSADLARLSACPPAARAGDHHRDLRRRALRRARSGDQGVARRRRLREVVLRRRRATRRVRCPASASASTPRAIPPRSTPR